MRRLFWLGATLVVAACGAFGAESDPVVPADDAGTTDVEVPPAEEDAGEIIVPPEALDSGAGSADATASGSKYGAAVLEDRPIAYWRMMQSAGVVVPNVIGQGLALVPDKPAGISPAAGALVNEPNDGALSFDRASVRAATPSAYAFGDRAPFTAECWAKVDRPASGVNVALAKANLSQILIFTNFDGWALAFDTAKGLAGAFYGGVKAEREDIVLRDWHHYAVVMSGERLQLFVDGVEVASSAVTNGSVARDKAFAVGGYAGDKILPFPGAVDEVALYDRALAADRIAAHVAASK